MHKKLRLAVAAAAALVMFLPAGPRAQATSCLDVPCVPECRVNEPGSKVVFECRL